MFDKRQGIPVFVLVPQKKQYLFPQSCAAEVHSETRFPSPTASPATTAKPPGSRGALMRALFYAVVLTFAVLSCSAFLHSSVSSQGRLVAPPQNMHQIFKLRGRLLALTTRAAFAASAGSYVYPSHPEWEDTGKDRWRSALSSRYSKFGGGWLRPSPPVLSRASSTASARSAADAPLRFRGASAEGQYS